jgi:hypothetical protein
VVPFELVERLAVERLVVARRVVRRRVAWPLLAVALRFGREGDVVLGAIW